MNAKSMKKAQAKYEEARRYVASYSSKPKPTPKAEPKVEPKAEPKVEPVTVKPMGKRIDAAEVKKLEKGHFFIVVTCGRERIEVQKRFKSITKANEWIAKHEYL